MRPPNLLIPHTPERTSNQAFPTVQSIKHESSA
jgi:hypothetical protein